MRESPDKGREAGGRFEPRNKQVDALFGELTDILTHVRAPDILLGEWFHESGLPIPSHGLMEFFAWDLLYGFGRYDRYFEAAKDVRMAIRNYSAHLSMFHEEALWDSIVASLGRRRIMELATGNPAGSLYWTPALMALEFVSDDIEILNAGRVRLARFMIEAMTIRSVYEGGSKYLAGLAQMEKNHRIPQKPEKIAFEAVRWHWHLSNKLGRPPSWEEMKIFLLAACPGLNGASATWTRARQLLPGGYFPLLRGGKTDPRLVSLGRAASGSKPEERPPQWRRPRWE